MADSRMKNQVQMQQKHTKNDFHGMGWDDIVWLIYLERKLGPSLVKIISAQEYAWSQKIWKWKRTGWEDLIKKKSHGFFLTVLDEEKNHSDDLCGIATKLRVRDFGDI